MTVCGGSGIATFIDVLTATGVSGVGIRIDVLTDDGLTAAGLTTVGRGGSTIGRIVGGLGTTAGTVCVRGAYTVSMAGIDAAGDGVYTEYIPIAG